jgi:acetyltransferase-like isoleucine patch superfamily enzyme
MTDAHTGAHARLDPDVLVNYPPSRGVNAELHMGAGAVLRSGTVIYGGSTIGTRLLTGHHVVVREECEIGDDVSIWSNTVVDYGCRIGHRVKIHSNCYVAQYTEIGDDAFLAPGVTIANDLYPGNRKSADHMAGPSIGVGAQIGVNVTILPFVRIGQYSLIGAGSVVTRDVPAGSVAFGNPARVTGEVGALRDVASRVAPEDSASRFRFNGAQNARR